MSTSGNDAALVARQEDDKLTEIARITPGTLAKAREELVNRDLPPALMAAFQAAANEASYSEKLNVLYEQQQDKAVTQQQQDQEKKERESQEAWLESMSPEYRQAYNQLMTTVDDADRQYDQMRQRLMQHGKELDDQGRDIDDKALHLSDGSRAYTNEKGELVDKNGVPLTGAKKDEANALAQSHTGPIASYASYQQNEEARVRNELLLQRIAAEEDAANKFRQDARDRKIGDSSQLQEGTDHIKQKLAATQATIDSTTVVNTVSASALMDLDGDDAPKASTPPHGSYANTVDHDGGINASGLTAPFNAATLGVPPAAPTPQPAQRPSVSAPAAPNP